VSRPKKYLVRATIDVSVEDSAGRELVDTVPISGVWQYFENPPAAAADLSAKILNSFARLEAELDRAVFEGLKKLPPEPPE
jgi:hypothetical protein